MKTRDLTSIIIGLIALVCMGLGGMARAQGTYYDAPSTPVDITKFGFGGDSSYPTYAHDTRLWIPNDVTVIRGVIVLANGANGDQRGRTAETDWQALARAHGFALMGTHGYVCYDGNLTGTVSVDTEVPVLLGDLAWYATASGHPEVTNLPFVLGGWSGGGQIAHGINTKIPERVIAFITNKGGNYIQPPLAAAALKTPSIGVAGQTDGPANRAAVKNNFESNRPLGALWANAFEWNTDHHEGNVDGVFFTFFDHAIRARYPAGATPLTGPVTLLDLPETSGWLAAEPTFDNGLSGTVYPYADYPGTKTSACWLMDADVANLYRGFATYGPANTAPAVSVTPVSVYGIAPVYATGQLIQFTVAVDSTFPGWVSADVYDGAVKLGTVTNGGSNTISAVRPWGGRDVTAIARDAAGNERTSIPQPFVVSNGVALTNNATTTVHRTSADLSATFCPAWGSYAVTAYWGTVNGGSTAANWQHSAVVGTWAGGDATTINYTATGLSEVTPYYFTFCATKTGSQVWAPSVLSFTTATPNAPTSNGAALTALEDTPTALAAGNFGYSDPLNVAFAAVQITSLPALGTLKNGGVTVVNGGLPLTVLAANIGNLTYQSALNGNGTPYTTIGIKVGNANGLWSNYPATMTLNVTPVNDAPTSTGGSVNLNGNAVRTFSAGDFPFADVDAGDTLGAVQVTSLPAQGTLKLNGAAITTVPSAVISLVNIGTLTYTAGTGYTVSDSFKFQVRDATLFSADATMTITGSSTFAVLTATNPTNSTTDYLTNTTGTITNTVTAAALNSLTSDTAAGNNIWDLSTGKTATITTGGLIMTGANNFTIQNGTLKSATASGFIVNQNGAGTLTLGSVIANGLGASTLTKSGTGILTLSGTNTYTGATTISGGILYLTNALALQNSALDTTNSVAGSDTAGLKTNATTLTLGGLTGNKDFASVFTTALGGYSGVTALTLNPGTGVTNTYSGIISDGTVGMALTKTGAGTQTLSGANTLTNATVNGGTIDITGGSLSLANGFVQVGSAVPGILKIDGGSLIVSSTGNNTGGLVAGGAAGNLGAIYLNSGAITTTTGFNLHIGGVGANSPTYGFLNITGGMLSGTQQRTRIGQYGGTGLWYQTGGTYSNTVSSSSIEVGSAGTGGTNIGVVYLSGGTFTSSTVMNVAPTNIGIATLTVAGSAALTVNAGLTVGAASGTTATVNLNGGTLTLNNSTVTNNATGTINFNGGTLKAGLAGALFSGTGSAYVYPGAATIDTQTNAVTISQALQAPAGNGVTTIPVTSAGSGYIGAPYVALTGDGMGATAVANMVDDATGNGTYKIGSITITCPGRGYTALTAATLSGGLPSGGTAAVLNFASATFAANAGGGLTKVGSGTLTLTGTNTYTGDTKVSGGELTVSGSSLADTGRLIIDGGKVSLNNAVTVGTLFFGTTQQAAGSYSATGTNGTIASTNFTGTGTLIVTTNPPGGTPTITTSGTLSALTSTYGMASSPVSFTVAGTTMTAGILVTAPTGFEVSQASGSGYGSTTTVGSAGTIGSTTVYVRLAATAPVGTYNSQNIVLSSSAATSVNVPTAASGNSVSAPSPVITLADTLGAVNTTYGTASVTPTSFRVSGTGLTGNLTVTPPAGYEVSLSSGSGYTTSLSITASGTLASTQVYARLAATTAVNGGVGYTGNITVSGGGASSQTLATASSTLAKATATVVVTPYTVPYDGNPQTATVTSITGVNGETGATVGTVTLNTTHTTAGTYASDSWFFTPSANYNSIGTTTSTITVTNGSFETRGALNNATYWWSLGSPWVGGISPQGYEVLQVNQFNTFTAAAAGLYALNLESWLVSVTQDLSTTVQAGNTLSMTFSGGRDKLNGGGKFTATFKVGTTEYTSPVIDTTLQAPDTWQSYMFTTPITNAGNLSIVFKPVSGRPWVDNLSNVSRTSDTPQAITNTINRKALSITAPTIAAKNYNGTATAGAVTVGTLSGFVGSETVTATGMAANYSSANAGTYTGNVVTYTLANGTNGGLAANYSLATGTATGVINKAGSSVTAPTVGAYTYTGSPQGPNSGATATGSTGAVTYSYVGTGSTTYSASAIQPTNAGTYTATATVVTDSNYNAASSTAAAFRIGKATPTATLAVSNSPTAYDGTAKSATVGITISSVPGALQSILTGGAATQTALGTYVVAADFVPNDTTNYNTLTAQPAGNFIITASFASWVATNGATGQTMAQDHDRDGVPNGIEYFLGGNTNTTGFTTLPAVVNTAGTRSVTWTKAAAGYSGVYGSDYVVQSTTTLTGTWTDEPATGGGVILSGNSVIYTFPSGPVKKFARLKVMGSP